MWRKLFTISLVILFACGDGSSVDYNIPLLTNPQNTKLFIESISKLKMKDLEIKDWESYE